MEGFNIPSAEWQRMIIRSWGLWLFVSCHACSWLPVPVSLSGFTCWTVGVEWALLDGCFFSACCLVS